MTNKDALGRLLEYTEWANRRVIRCAATLPAADFCRDLGSSHGGVRGTLTHMMGAEWIWLERFKGVSPTKGIDEGDFKDVLALRARWKAIEQHRRSWFQNLDEAAVSKLVRYKTLKGQSYKNPLWQLVQHVCNHSSYHRGQAVTLLRQLGARVVSTDMVQWDRER